MPHCKTLDYDALLEKLGGDTEFVASLLQVAVRSSAALPAELRQACAAADFAALAKIAHKIKGTAGDLVAEGLRDRAREAELAARESKPESIGLNLKLADALDEFLTEARSLVAAG